MDRIAEQRFEAETDPARGAPDAAGQINEQRMVLIGDNAAQTALVAQPEGRRGIPQKEFP